MVAAVSRALRELSEPCLGWTRESRRQPKSLGARRQCSQATANNVLPVMTGSPAFLTRPPPGYNNRNPAQGVLWSWHRVATLCQDHRTPSTELRLLYSQGSPLLGKQLCPSDKVFCGGFVRIRISLSEISVNSCKLKMYIFTIIN